MYLASKESIGNCRSSSDFNENLMKIHKKSENPNFKILKRTNLGTDPGNKCTEFQKNLIGNVREVAI